MDNNNDKGLRGIQPISMDFPNRRIPELDLEQGGEATPVPNTVEGLLSALVQIQLNKPSFTIAVVAVDIRGQPVRGPDIQIPDGAVLTVRLRAQTGVVTGYVSSTSGGARNPNGRSQLSEGGSIGVRVRNMQAVWLNADTNNATFELIAEQ